MNDNASLASTGSNLSEKGISMGGKDKERERDRDRDRAEKKDKKKHSINIPTGPTPAHFPSSLRSTNAPEQLMTVKVGVPKTAVGLVLGKGEARLKSLCQATNCKLSLVQEQRSQQGEWVPMSVGGIKHDVRGACMVLNHSLTAKSYSLKFL